VDPEALQALLDPAEHGRHGVALERGELLDVVAGVALLGRRLTPPRCLDGRAEALHLRAGVVVVVLALHLVPREGEEARDRVPVGAVPGRRHRDRAGRVGRHHLDLDAFARRRRAAAEVGARRDHLPERLGEPGGREPEVEEPRRRRLGALDRRERGCRLRQARGDLERRPLLHAGETQRDVGGVVAVLGLGGALEHDRDAGRPGQLLLEAAERRRRRLPHVHSPIS
jgi:hypothetical protein